MDQFTGSGGSGAEPAAYCARCAEKDRRIEVLETMSYPDAQRCMHAAFVERDEAHGMVMRRDATIATLTAERDALQSATRKVVEAGRKLVNTRTHSPSCCFAGCTCGATASFQCCLEAFGRAERDPVIVALGRE